MKDIDEYQDFLITKLDSWTPTQRVAFAAGMAERWLHVYDKFSANEDWGDAANLHRMLDALWGHVQGQSIGAAQLQQFLAQLQESTPHMDDFDDEAALAACIILSEALRTCSSAKNTREAVGAALSGFEAAVPDWAFDPEEQPRLWRKNDARAELKKQLKLIEQINATTSFDQAAVSALRQSCKSKDFIGKPSAPKKPSTASTGISNQTAFEQYRSMLAADLKQPLWDPPAGIPYAAAMYYATPWMARYSRRLQTINGSYGKLADPLAADALVALNRMRDAIQYAGTMWNSEMREMVDMILGNPVGVIDAKSIDQLHGYGPSLRRLWVEAKLVGKSDQDAFARIIEWARHQPVAWVQEDQRKKKGLAHYSPALGDYLARPLAWQRSSYLECPWETEVDGQKWCVRLNDFPDDIMYTLLIGEEEIGPFHDWPGNWQRS